MQNTLDEHLYSTLHTFCFHPKLWILISEYITCTALAVSVEMLRTREEEIRKEKEREGERERDGEREREGERKRILIHVL